MTRSRDDLHDYQIEAIEELKSREEAFVWLGMGAGKTAIALTVIADLGLPALVVGTKRIVEMTWPKEIESWTHLTGLSYASGSGGKRQLEKAIEAQPDILAVNYESLKKLYEMGGHSGREILIFDEISKMKAHGTQRFRAHSKHSATFAKRFGLTATPATESYLGLWAQCSSIVRSRPLGRTITDFRSRFTTQEFKGVYTEYTVSEDDKRKIEECLAPFIVTVDGEHKREAPTIVDIEVPWRASGSKARYEQMERDLIVELENTTIAAASKGVAYNKCRQLASGFIYDADGVAQPVDEGKIDAIIEAYDELGEDPAIIFYQFVWERDELLRRILGACTLDDPATLERWDRGEIPALVLHPASGGHGLNLQSGHHIIWASLPWSLEQYLQANGRIDRQGQEHQVVITRIFREGTIERDVADKLDEKWTTQAELMNRIKSRQR